MTAFFDAYLSSLKNDGTTQYSSPQYTLPTIQINPTGQVNPNTQVNPMYTRQQPTNSLAPMAMYQNYLQTGQLPQEQSSFQPWSNPQGVTPIPSGVTTYNTGNK